MLAVFLYKAIVPGAEIEILAYSQLVQIYALCAVVFLYLALLASPLYKAFPTFPFKPVYIKARRALGVSAFLFGALHGSVVFFKLLNGFRGLAFLNGKPLLAIIFSVFALLILLILTVTSLDPLVKKLGRLWKPIHRLVYLAGILIVIHALLLGSHFVDLSARIPQLFFIALFVLLALEALRLFTFIQKYVPEKFHRLLIGILIIPLLLFIYYSFISPSHKASAHTIKTDKSVGVIIHIEPHDKPRAREQSTLYVEFSKKDGHFDLSDCSCTATITKDNQTIQTTTMTQSESNTISKTPVVFPEAGLYVITISGIGPEMHEFEFVFDTKILPAEPLSTKSGQKKDYYPYIALAGLLITGYGIYVAKK